MAQRRKSPGEAAFAEHPGQIDVDQSAGAGAGSIVPIGTIAGGAGYEGAVGGIEKNKIVGWAWNSAAPYVAVTVELFINDVCVGRGPADIFDMELAQSNRGNGKHRFELSVEKIPPGLPPYLVRAVIADTDVELLPAVTLATIDSAESLVSGNEYLGKVTGITDGMLRGWVINWNNPHEQPAVTLLDGEEAIITRLPVGRTKAVIESGVTASAHAFELPLPASVLDGRQHVLSVRVGPSARELPGSPIMFGPTDVASIGHSLSVAFEKLHQLERDVFALRPSLDQGQIERRMTGNILDRVDMLLNIHRDSIERELAVLRRQVTELSRRSASGTADVIQAIDTPKRIDDEVVEPPQSFTVIARSAPLITYDLTENPEAVKPRGDVIWSRTAGSPGLSIAGSGGADLHGIPGGPATLIVHGSGAVDPLEFCGIVFAYHGLALIGRVEIGDSGDWVLLGTTAGRPVDALAASGLAVRYLPDMTKPSAQLTMNRIAILPANRVPERFEPAAPKTVVRYIGSESSRDGWYAVEPGARGGFNWMGAQAEIVFRVRPASAYRLNIPEIRPLAPEIMPKLQIMLGGVAVKAEVTPASVDNSVFSVAALARLPANGSEDLTLRLSFPDDCVRSPMELGRNDDQRPLTMAVRAVTLSAVTP